MNRSKQFDTVARVEVWDGGTRYESYAATAGDPDHAIRRAIAQMLPDVRHDIAGALAVLPEEQFKVRLLGDLYDYVIHTDLVC